MFAIPLVLSLSCLVSSALAQTYTRRRRHSLAGGIIAAIVVACIAGIILCLILSMLARRRRRGQTMLPGPGGFSRFGRSGPTPGGPASFGVGAGNGYQQTGPGSTLPPPPYQGKETYPGQTAAAPPPGGYAPPPGPPPPAHLNDNAGRFGWFNKNTQ